MEITITAELLWIIFKWSGLVLFILSGIALFAGSLPDNEEKPLGDVMRLITWPLFGIWIIAMLIKGIFF